MRHWCLEPTLAIAIWESALATARESSKSEAIWWRSQTGATFNCFLFVIVRHLFRSLIKWSGPLENLLNQMKRSHTRATRSHIWHVWSFLGHFGVEGGVNMINNLTNQNKLIKFSDLRHYHCVSGIRKPCLRPRSDTSLCRKSFAPVCLIFQRNSRFPLFLTSFYLDICRREIF